MAEKKRNFDYYDPLTTGDSSLSPCIQSVAAAELGYAELAYAYFMRTARMDLDDVNGNVSHGVHTAAMAGSWISLVYGFAGSAMTAGGLSFAPRLPAAWGRLRFRLPRPRGTLLQVTSQPTRRRTSCSRARAGDPPLRPAGAVAAAGEPVTSASTRTSGRSSSTSTA